MTRRLINKDIRRRRPAGGRQSRVRRFCLAASCLALAILQTGCASHAIRTVPVFGPETEVVVDEFVRMRSLQQECGRFLDAEVEVAIQGTGLFGNGSLVIPGYLQAMSPSYFKFIGVNPLGQPHLILATDGKRFRSVVVPDAKGYEGEVGSAKFRKYSPPGFLPEQGFFWLTGRLGPGRMEIAAVSREKGASGYWLKMRSAPEESVDRLLFDPDRGVVVRRIIQDGRGRILMDVRYDGYRRNGGCLLPGRITVSLPYNGRLNLAFGTVYPDSVFSAADFKLDLPAGFENVVVK